MQAPSKSKAWKNDDLDIQQEPAKDDTTKDRMQENEEEGEQSADEYQSIPKKRKAGKHQDESLADREGSEEPLEFPENRQSRPISGSQATQDDSNWLKSKTGHLLGLDEEEQQDDNDGVIGFAPTARDSSAESGSEGPAIAKVDKTPGKADSPLMPVEEATEQVVDGTEAQIRASKRLFLRNLPFTITEEALMDEFARFGQLEEVCAYYSLHSTAQHRCMMNPDRDS